MSLEIKTISHGEIDAGFYSNYIQLVILGDYFFHTKSMCEMIEQVADNRANGNLNSYKIEDYERYREEFARRIWANRSSQDDGAAFDRLIEDSLEEVLPGGESVGWCTGPERISIGKYIIPAVDFYLFAAYLARGGIFGWLTTPGFAKSAAKALENSVSPLILKGKLDYDRAMRAAALVSKI